MSGKYVYMYIYVYRYIYIYLNLPKFTIYVGKLDHQMILWESYGKEFGGSSSESRLRWKFGCLPTTKEGKASRFFFGWKRKGWKIRKIPGGFFGGESFTYIYIHICMIYIYIFQNTYIYIFTEEGRQYGYVRNPSYFQCRLLNYLNIFEKLTELFWQTLVCNSGNSWKTFSPRAYEEDFQIWPSLPCNWQDSSTNQLAATSCWEIVWGMPKPFDTVGTVW